MKIERITISNFRCFGPEPTTINFEPGVTAFVGNNGSGKTAIFAALGKLFGVTTALRTIRKSDFHVPINQEEIEPNAAMFIDCVLDFPELEGDAAEDAAIPDLFRHMSAAGVDEPVKVRMRLQATWLDNATPEGEVETELRWITALDDDFNWEHCQRVGPLDRSYIQLVYVPASRNAFDQVTNLLKGRLWRAARWSTDLSDTASAASRSIQNKFDAEVPAQFIAKRLERRWQQVNQGDTNAKPILRLVENRLEDLVRRAEFVFSPDNAQQIRKLDDLSDGQKSLFHIALTAATLEIERDALAAKPMDSAFDQEKLRRTHLTLLAIEEPENSLSPFFLSRIMSQAREIGALVGAQVILSSHSASILSRIEPEEIRYARLDNELRQSSVCKLTLPPEKSDASRFVRLAVRTYPELYFARFVILAEGESESIVIPRLAEVKGFPLDKSFVPIVPLGGRFVHHFWRLLNDLKIPYATLLDLDLGRRYGGANVIKKIVGELKAIGRSMDDNSVVQDGEIVLNEIDEIDDTEILRQKHAHPWLKGLRLEGIYFSSPIDLDFAMLSCFPNAYKVPNEGGRGPRTTPEAIAQQKHETLKKGGKPDLYPDSFDSHFSWYPYLFLATSKPEVHLAALCRIEDNNLRENAPIELRQLLEYVRDTLQ